jgi:crossover junction endodeoxyribonuclease RusA
MIELTLPWPPSNNVYYRHQNGVHHISADGKAYQKAVNDIVWEFKAAKQLAGRLSVSIEVYPRTKGRHDLDNLLKVPLDCLMKAGVYVDDSQIDELSIKRMTVGGMLKVKIEVIE